jgi:hypothetical protein
VSERDKLRVTWSKRERDLIEDGDAKPGTGEGGF